MVGLFLGLVLAQDPCNIELLAPVRSAKPGDSFTIAVKMKMEPGWHTYWRNPGDSGSATTFDWELPEGWKAGEVVWPVPGVLTDGNGMVSFAYEGEALFLTQVTVPSSAPRGAAQLGVTTNWVACREECIAGTSRATASVLVSESVSTAVAGARTIADAVGRMPGLFPASLGKAVAKDRTVSLTLDVGDTDADFKFLPYAPVFDHSQLTFVRQGPKATLSLRLLPSSNRPIRLEGLVIASKPGVWGDKTTAKVIKLLILSS